MTETVAEILSAYRCGAAKPEDMVARSFARIRAHADPAIFITLRDEAEAVAEARALARAAETTLPLYGMPFAVKDNIDVAGLPTTAACPAFAYTAGPDATAVARLRAAGALVIGKTNLDQFATGLVGVRSPYGMPRNLFDAKLIPGGSSSGSAVAVAAGLVPLALGTDTAGSGRVPAALQQHRRPEAEPRRRLDGRRRAGLPHARLRVGVRAHRRRRAGGARARSPAPIPPIPIRARRPLGVLGPCRTDCGSACRSPASALFFGDQRCRRRPSTAALARFAGSARRSSRSTSSRSTRRRVCSTRGRGWPSAISRRARSIASSPESLHPVTRADHSRRRARAARPTRSRPSISSRSCAACAIASSARSTCCVVPTAPTVYTIEQVLADPIGLNSRLGTYTNFVNLLDLCGLAVPAWMRPDGMPFGVTLLAPAGEEAALAAIGRAFHCRHPPAARRARARRSRRLRGLRRRGPRRNPSRSSARISPACRSTANCVRRRAA